MTTVQATGITESQSTRDRSVNVRKLSASWISVSTAGQNESSCQASLEYSSQQEGFARKKPTRSDFSIASFSGRPPYLRVSTRHVLSATNFIADPMTDGGPRSSGELLRRSCLLTKEDVYGRHLSRSAPKRSANGRSTLRKFSIWSIARSFMPSARQQSAR